MKQAWKLSVSWNQRWRRFNDTSFTALVTKSTAGRPIGGQLSKQLCEKEVEENTACANSSRPAGSAVPSLRLTGVCLARSVGGGSHLASPSVWVAFKFLVESNFTVDLFHFFAGSGQSRWRKEGDSRWTSRGRAIKSRRRLFFEHRAAYRTKLEGEIKGHPFKTVSYVAPQSLWAALSLFLTTLVYFMLK